MKKFYTKPKAEILLISMEEGACVVTASTAQTEGFTPVPGIWDAPTI